MVQTKEEKAISRKVSQKKWREKNKEKVAIYREKNKERDSIKWKEYREANKGKISIKDKEERKAYMKAYNEANKEKLAIKHKAYNEANKEKLAIKKKAYNKRPARIKASSIKTWKNNGVIGDLKTFYDERYFPATNCEVCEKVFKSSRDKHMDHCHTTGEIRHVLCCSCNSHDHWKKVLARKEEATIS